MYYTNIDTGFNTNTRIKPTLSGGGVVVLHLCLVPTLVSPIGRFKVGFRIWYQLQPIFQKTKK
jgi:hypothetical protein